MSKQYKKSIKQRAVAALMSAALFMTSVSLDGVMASATEVETETITETETAAKTETALETNSTDVASSTENGSETSSLTTEEESSEITASELFAEDEKPSEVILEGTDKNSGFAVSVTGDTKTLANAQDVTVAKIDDMTSWQKAIDSLDDDMDREVIAVYDVTILNKNANAIEPDGTVSVSFSGDIIAEALKDERKLEIYHLPDDTIKASKDESSADSESSEIVSSETEVSSDNDKEVTESSEDNKASGSEEASSVTESSENESSDIKLKVQPKRNVRMKAKSASIDVSKIDNVYPQKAAADEVVFNTDGFSQYAVVLGNSNTQVEINYNDVEYFEADKYLTLTGQNVNGQPAGVITIEQAYHNKNQVVLEKLPARGDIIIAIDQSASMMYKTQFENEYMLHFLYNIMMTNKEREQKAKNNEYTDFTYTGDDSALETALADHWIYVNGCLKFAKQTHTSHKNEPLVIRTWNDVTSFIDCKCGYDAKGNKIGCGKQHYWFDDNGELCFFEDKPSLDCVYDGPLHSVNELTHDPDRTPQYKSGHQYLDCATRTDFASLLALEWAKEINTKLGDKTQIFYLLVTDGEPYYYELNKDGSPKNDRGNENGIKGTSLGVPMPDKNSLPNDPNLPNDNPYKYVYKNFQENVINANIALEASRQIKELGSLIYIAYDCQGNKDGIIRNLKAASYDNFRLGLIDPKTHKPYLTMKVPCHTMYDKNEWDLAFMTAYSSDYKRSGIFEYSTDMPIKINTINDNIKLTMKLEEGPSLSVASGISLSDYTTVDSNGVFEYPFVISDEAGNSEDYNTFGDYLWSISRAKDASENVKVMSEICRKMDRDMINRTNGDTGYASYDSYIYDEITDPFVVENINDIKVYAVPRIPINLDENDVPVGFDVSKGCNNEVTSENIQMLDDDDFRWGEKTLDDNSTDNDDPNVKKILTEWIDITNDVVIDASLFSDNIIKISGYDYEHVNSVRNYDIDYAKSPAAAGANGAGLSYKPGDYGYKLVVEIPIISKTSFGGNNIKTNNTEVSGFYPSKPVNTENGLIKRPIWTENEKSGGKPYITLYPECKMNLRINYNIVSDNAVIYAPETKKLHDLVTDVNNSIWYVDDEYQTTLNSLNEAKSELERLEQSLANANKALDEAGNDESKLAADARPTYFEGLISKQYAKINDLNNTLNSLGCYIPDGIKNAFVDITYTFTSPSGKDLATMTIPHGKAYFLTDGTPSIDWVINDGADALITESGTYTIKTTVTPVATNKSPSWHVSTEASTDEERAATPYDSREYSPTGSDGINAPGNNTIGDIGPSNGQTFTANPKAFLYTLKIVVNDTKKEPDTRIDVNEGLRQSSSKFISLAIASGSNNIRRGSDGTYDCTGNGLTHIESFKWVCTDGHTPSVKENEPNYNGNNSDSDVSLLTSIPNDAITNGLVKDVNGNLMITASDGGYVPISSVLERKYKFIGKDEDQNAWSESIPLTDSDNIYGNGVSSVTWTHKCDANGSPISETCNDADGELQDAVRKYGDDVEYLIHIFSNPTPQITKEVTEGATISKGDTFKWTITTMNNNQETNPNKRISNYSMIDILPHANDGRGSSTKYAPVLPDGSKIDGTLKYTSIKIDFTNAQSAKGMFMGSGGMYFTNSAGVYDYPNNIGTSDVVNGGNGIVWNKVTNYGFDGNMLTFSGFSESSIYAFKLDTMLAFGESLSIYIEANTVNPSDKQEGNVAVNEAYIYMGDGFIASHEVPIEVTGLSMSGTVWIDTDFTGTISNGEPHVSGVSIGLYRKKESDSTQISSVVRDYTLSDGSKLQLVAAYDVDNNPISNVTTADDGNFAFTNLNPGTYYIVADVLPKDYNIVKQHVGSSSRNGYLYDSEAEEYFLNNGSDSHLDNSAIIKEIAIGNGGDTIVSGLNIGLTQFLGKVRVGKTVDTIKLPSTFTDEQRKAFKAPVIFYLKNLNTGEIFTRVVEITEENHMSYMGKPQVWAEFNDIPLGTYLVYENEMPGNLVATIESADTNVSIDTSTAEIELTTTDTDAELWFANTFMDQTTYSYNYVNMHKPIKLEIKYKGPDPVGMGTNLLTYEFKRDDFDDIIVTYDDGTTASLRAGTLRFEDVILIPGNKDKPITRFMNTSDNGRIAVTGFYAERGQVVSDSFSVGVSLKAINKFTVRFHCNYESSEGGTGFSGSSTKGFVDNVVTFMYDEQSQIIEVTGGEYLDQGNSGLSAPWYYYNHNTTFTQCGWNTKADSSGIVFAIDSTSSNNINSILAAIGDYMYKNGKKDMDWYADWKGTATFMAGYDGNDGYLIDGLTDAEIAARGKSSITVTLSKGQKLSTNMSGKIDNKAQISYFDHWNNSKNNAEDGDLSPTTIFRGGEIYYAIYYVAEFKYTGTSATFTAPSAGSYTFQLWGSPGGNRISGYNASTGKAVGGRGAYTQVTMTLQRNQVIYAFVGSAGAAAKGDDCAGGYNGGGPSLVCLADPHSASGGGATHISTSNNPIISDVIVKLIGDAQNDEGLDVDEDESYSMGTIKLHYGSTIKGVSQGTLMQFVRNKLMTSDNYYKNYVTSSTEVQEIGKDHSYNSNGRTSKNPAWFVVKCSTWNNIDDVIAVAGGGGGGGDAKNPNGNEFGWAGDDKSAASKGTPYYHKTTWNNNMKAADNSSNTGYKHGAGQWNVNCSGGGAGWWGGYSAVNFSIHSLYQTNGGNCSDIGSGGTSYINTSHPKVTVTDGFSYAGNNSLLDSTYKKPSAYDIGVNGYIKITKN